MPLASEGRREPKDAEPRLCRGIRRDGEEGKKASAAASGDMLKSSGAGEETGDGLVSSSDDRRASSDGTAVEKARRLSSSIHCE